MKNDNLISTEVLRETKFPLWIEYTSIGAWASSFLLYLLPFWKDDPVFFFFLPLFTTLAIVISGVTLLSNDFFQRVFGRKRKEVGVFLDYIKNGVASYDKKYQCFEFKDGDTSVVISHRRIKHLNVKNGQEKNILEFTKKESAIVEFYTQRMDAHIKDQAEKHALASLEELQVNVIKNRENELLRELEEIKSMGMKKPEEKACQARKVVVPYT